MSLSKALAVGPLVLVMFASGAHAQAPASPPKRDEAPMTEAERAAALAGFDGQVEGSGCGRGQIAHHRRAPAAPGRAGGAHARPPWPRRPQPAASVDWRRLQGEVSQRFGDLEACRNKIARQEKVAVEDLRAGLVVLRWTILPSGRTAQSVVYQQRETELALVKCIRARMDAWQFTPASSDPIVIEQTYDFQAALAAAARATASAATPPAPPASTEARTSSGSE